MTATFPMGYIFKELIGSALVSFSLNAHVKLRMTIVVYFRSVIRSIEVAQ